MTLKTHNPKAFRQDFKRLFRGGKSMEKLLAVMELLEKELPLDAKYQDHSLSGIWKEYRECHIASNWLLVYKVAGDVITFARTGSHSDIFQKY